MLALSVLSMKVPSLTSPVMFDSETPSIGLLRLSRLLRSERVETFSEKFYFEELLEGSEGF